MTPPLATILVIDDEPVILESISDYLEDRNYRVLTATDGQTGLELLTTENPDLVLTDLRMPKMGGMELLRRASKVSPDTPVIVISGTGNIGDSVRVLRLGAWDYILKPIEDLSIITHSIDKAFERVRLLTQNRAYQERLEILVHERTQELERANADLSAINKRLRKIVDTTRKLSVCSDVLKFGSELLTEFAAHMLATGGSLFIVENDGLRLLNTLDERHVPDVIPFPLPKNSILNQVIKEKIPILIRDIDQEKKYKNSGWTGYRDGSALLFPLPDETGEIAEVLTLHNKISPPFLNQDKEIGAILASYSCETLRAVRSTESLRVSEERYRMLFEKSTDAIFVVAGTSGQYLDGNETASQLTGRSRRELLQSTIYDIAPSGISDLLENFYQIQTARELGKMTFHRPDGEKRIANVSIVPLKDEVCMLIARDITDELAMEAQLIQAQKMEAVGRLAGGVAHDLNNLLSPIIGYSELLLSDTEIKNHHREYMDEILNAGFRARNLVRQLLAFSRKQTLEFKPVEINQTIAEFEKLLRRTIPEDIAIKVKLGGDIKPVMADVGQIEQVILNLAVNSADAMPNGGRLTIETTMAKISEEKKSSEFKLASGIYVVLSIKDTGCGMDQATRDRIFEPFFSTKGERGTGLGLSTVYGIITQHGGRIMVSSRPDQGTIFDVYLPITEKTEIETDTKIHPFEKLNGSETILLVEDNNIVREMAQTILQKQGYAVLAAKDGKSALSLLADTDHPVSLLLTDVVMPAMNGRELYDKALEIQPALKALYMSGYTDEVIAHHGVLEKGIHFIQKPFTIQALAAKVREVLEQK